MTAKSIKKEYALVGLNEVAFFTVERSGQEDPSQGDRVQVTCSLHLPASNKARNSSLLLEELRFSDRLSLDSYSLTAYWGNGHEGKGNTRFLNKKFLAKNWKDAFYQAECWSETQINKLNNALRERKRTLEEAEGE